MQIIEPTVVGKDKSLSDRIGSEVAARGWVRLSLGQELTLGPVPEIENWLKTLSEELGALVPQTFANNLIAQIRNQGGDYGNHAIRGHQTDAELAPHSDRCDWNILLYVRTARSGGELSIIGYEEAALALRQADRAAYQTLFEDFPFDLRVERLFLENEWHVRPVLWKNAAGATRGHYIRRFIADSARHPDCPPLTSTQSDALDRFDAILAREEMVHRFIPQAGDLVVLDNYRVMHARSAYQEDPGSQRLALRTWIAPFASELLPDFLAPLCGSCRAGTYRGGVSNNAEHIGRLGQPLVC